MEVEYLKCQDLINLFKDPYNRKTQQKSASRPKGTMKFRMKGNENAHYISQYGNNVFQLTVHQRNATNAEKRGSSEIRNLRVLVLQQQTTITHYRMAEIHKPLLRRFLETSCIPRREKTCKREPRGRLRVNRRGQATLHRLAKIAAFDPLVSIHLWCITYIKCQRENKKGKQNG